MAMRMIRLAAAAMMAALVSAQAAAQSAGDAFGAMRAIFYHELGHGLIDVLGLPVVGPEEDVVDEFSAYMLILTGRRDDRQIEALFATAQFWKAVSDQLAGAPHPQWGEHPPSERRVYAILCLMHGSDPGRFYPLMNEFGVPQSRARKCEVEYAEKERTWLALLEPHRRGGAGAGDAGFSVSYAPAQSADAADIAAVWRQTRFLESLANEASMFGLPREIAIIGRECGVANAFWDGRAITLCYEMQVWANEMLTNPPPAEDPITASGGRADEAADDAIPNPEPSTPTPTADDASALGGGGGGAQNIGDLLGGRQ